MRNQLSKQKRKSEVQETSRTMLIVCEGEKTEPNYFKGFLRDLENSKIKVKIIGEGYNTVSLVKRTMEIRGNEANYCRVWVVFDRDSFKTQQFKNATLYD
ncbi:hypothetical protein MBAV_003909 [Candidatus Magnetobacterium bavaricum]|uniref:RloB domain-containing protein n=1 Tax=Candidatus Magnetobacterium bavaricum TaxID=29290 RepID=A0A0F3GT99_9BACT|nr:hypothetical protein MBAV_003909 [Candidatus Magnetobacterium bavaricum]